MGKDLILVLAGVLFVASPESLQAEPLSSVTVAAVLSEDQAVFQRTLEGFEAELRSRGHAPQIQVYDLANAARAATSGAKLVLALGTAAAQATSRQDATPMVFAVVGDPAGIDLMDAAHLPKKNATGVAALVPLRAQLELVAKTAPDAKRIGLVTSTSCSNELREEMEREARAAGWTVVFIRAANANAVGVELRANEAKIDAIIALADASIWTAASVKATVIFSIQNKKPLFGFSSGFTRAGAIASVSAEDYADMGAQAGERAHELLSGKNVRDLKIAEPRKLSTSINLVVARRIGLEPSRELVDRAEVVFR